MPFSTLVFEITGRGAFHLEGSFELTADVLGLIDRWLTTLASEDAAQLATLVAKLKRNNDALVASVHAHEGTFAQPTHQE